jgi:ATP-binding cassette subfamily C protein CydD
MINRTISLGVLSGLLGVALAWSISAGVSEAVGGDHAPAWIVVGLLALSGRAWAQWSSERLAARCGMRMVEVARADILQSVADRGAGQMLGEAPGVRVSQIMDRTALLAGWASRWLPGVRLAVLVPVIMLIAVATQSWVAALLLAVSVFALPVFLWLTVAETRAIASVQQASLDTLASVFQTRTEHAGLIKAFRAIGREADAVRLAAETLRQRTMRVLRVAFLSTAVLEFFSAISIALLAVYIGFKLLGLFPFETGEVVTLREGMMVLILAPEFFSPIRRMSALHHDRADAAAASSVLAEWLDRKVERTDRLPALSVPPLLSFADVSLSFGAQPVVRGLSFEAQPGRITALSGPSGSGKTSVLLSLLGLARLAGGEVRIDGVSFPVGSSLANSIAYVRQTPWLFEGTLVENVRIGRPEASDEEVMSVLARVGAVHLAAAEVGGLGRSIGRGGQGLSGGERQRIAIARALLRDARIWLLDEPTAHLDDAAEADILQLLRTHAAERTIIVATHSVGLLRAADNVVLMPSSERLAA